MINAIIPAIIMIIAFYNFVKQRQDLRIPSWSIAAYWFFVTIYWLIRVCKR